MSRCRAIPHLRRTQVCIVRLETDKIECALLRLSACALPRSWLRRICSGSLYLIAAPGAPIVCQAFHKERFMQKTVVQTNNAPAAIGPYSQCIDTGNMIFVSGQIPVNPATGQMPATIEEQARQSLTNLKAIVEAAGSSMDKVVKTTCFLADINDFAAFNAVYAEFFPAQGAPARSAVQVAAIPKAALCEVEAIALK